MKINVCWVGYSPIDITKPQYATILLRAIFDAMARGEPAKPVDHFRFELAGIQCIGCIDPYELVEVEPEPEDCVRVHIHFFAPGCGVRGQPFIAEDGQLGAHIEFEEDDFKSVILDSDEISWRM
jgi:hypothetical protein